MRERLTRDQVLTIPNAMSAFRIVLIPFIIWSYWRGRVYLAVLLVALSALSDIFDGVVARKLNMISDLGKVLDPVADKLTHAALLICVAVSNRYAWYLFGLLAVKEITMFIVGFVVFRRNDYVHAAQWHGKLCTVVVESSMMVMMLFPGLPDGLGNAIISLCAATMVFSFVLYLVNYARMLRKSVK